MLPNSLAENISTMALTSFQRDKLYISVRQRAAKLQAIKIIRSSHRALLVGGARLIPRGWEHLGVDILQEKPNNALRGKNSALVKIPETFYSLKIRIFLRFFLC